MIKELLKEIQNLKNPVKAKILQGFFKTGKGQYGEGDRFLGITVPKQRKLVKEYWKVLTLADIHTLLKSKFHEERLIALLILVKKFTGSEIFNPCLFGRQKKSEIYKFYLSHTKFINNWDLVDLSAPNIVGEYLKDRNKAILIRLAKSKNLWEKRIAILATFAFIKQGISQETLNIAKILLLDSHDLIHKAVGWMLREVGKRCKQSTLTNFLDKHASQMPRTMLRYSIERLPEPTRKYYLNKTYANRSLKRK